MIVFRYRQRGLPVEVSAAERNRAVERFASLIRTAGRTIAATTISGLLAVNWLMPRAFGAVPLIVGVYLGIVATWAMMARWAWDQPTRGWRGRTPVGEPLGWVGAWLMRLEQARLGQLLYGAGTGGVLLVLAIEYPGDPWWFLPLTAALSLVMFAAIVAKVGLSERRRLRQRRFGDLRQSRDLHLP